MSDSNVQLTSADEDKSKVSRAVVYFKKELLFKFVVIGEFGVGKTSIINRFAEDTFSSTYKITIGIDFAIKRIEWDENTVINLQLWDIAGHERFGTLTSVYYRHAIAAAIVFDLTRPVTFKYVEKWLTDLRKKSSLPNNQALPVILLANKGDITTDSVPTNMDAFCKQNDIMTWLITSAKENVNLDYAVKMLINASLNEPCESDEPQSIKLSDGVAKLSGDNGKKCFCGN